MWHNTFDTEPNGRTGRTFYEPLPTAALQDTQPYVCYVCTVIFYKKPFPGALEKVDEVVSQWNLLGQRFTDEWEGWSAVAPLVQHEGEIYELCSGQVIWREGQWFKKWTGRRLAEDDRRRPYIKEATNV